MSVSSPVVDAAKQTSPSRPSSRHQVSRSLSELNVPGKIHRRPHLHRRQSSKQEERTNPSSSLQARESLDLAMSSGNTPFISPNVSRRASILLANPDDAERPQQESKQNAAQEQGKAALLADNLKQSLSELGSFSRFITKRLDDTYYSVLEKMSKLHVLVTALNDVAGSIDELCGSFDKDSRDLESDIIRQLSAAGQFEEQQRRISSLKKRIYASRETAEALATRVDNVQKRVDQWEQADRQWQERTRKRLKRIWIVGTLIALSFCLLMFGMSQVNGDGQASVAWRAAVSPNLTAWLDVSGRKKHGRDDGEETGRRLLKKKMPTKTEQLRVFDEL